MRVREEANRSVFSRPGFSWWLHPTNVIRAAIELVMRGFDLVMHPLQRLIGIKGMAYIFVLPNLFIFGVFILIPMAMNVYYSMTSGTALFLQDRTFVGLDNYRILFDCQNFLKPTTCNEDRFWYAIHNTPEFVVFQVGGMLLLSLITALILNRNIKGRGFFRGIFFYPVLLSPVVVALIWKWILQREGVLNAIITAFGGERILFLLNPAWATFWVITVSIWAQMGFYTLILLAGLQAIPPDLYEAGAIDGAGRWQAFRYITLPLWMPTILVVLVLSLIRAVQVFDHVYVLTGGGPGTATYYIIQYIYETGFASQIPRRGLAASASLIMGGVLLVLSLVQLLLGRNAEAA